MKITVINGTEKKGVTFRLKEIFLETFSDDAGITEFYLPRDCPNCCAGCTVCFLKDEHLCKDAEYVQKIEKAMFEADLLVFASPAYVFHATGAMKTMLDHFGYRWMPHRPAKEMFGKRAVIITQCLGAGGKSAVSEKKKASMTAKLGKAAEQMRRIDYSRPARTGLITRAKFYAVRMLQKNLGKQDPEYTDYQYWKNNGWTGSARPWKHE